MPAEIPIPPQHIIKYLLNYVDGTLYFNNRYRIDVLSNRGFSMFNARFAGKVAGYINNAGYTQIRLNSKLYLAHRLIWVWHYGDIPDGYEIDHKDGNNRNNNIDNLRCVTSQVNCRNARRRSDNTSGISGVHFEKRSGKWSAKCGFEKKIYYLGRHSTFSDAANAVKSFHAEKDFTERHGI